MGKRAGPKREERGREGLKRDEERTGKERERERERDIGNKEEDDSEQKREKEKES